MFGLGDPTHQDSTITKYRIDLIKKIINEKGIDIIAIEGNIFELFIGHNPFVQNGKFSFYQKSIYEGLICREMDSLYQFLFKQNSKDHNVQFLGIDSIFSGVTYTSKK